MGEKCAAYDDQGNIRGFYDSVDSPISQNMKAILLTEEQWQEAISRPGYIVKNGQLVSPVPPTFDKLLRDAKETQSAKLSNACQKEIASSFQSSALGAIHIYPSTIQDQINQVIVSQMVSGGSMLCISQNGNQELLVYTQQQAQHVLDALMAHMNICQAKLQVLKNKVSRAVTIEAVQDVVWSIA